VTEQVVVFESLATGERYEVDFPLTSTRDPADLRDELGLPTYIDATESHVGRALAVLWAARHAASLADQHAALAKVRRPPRVCLFGGVAYRFLCPSANEDPVFQRRPGDLDLVTSRADGDAVVAVLSTLAEILGSRYWHVVTKSDEMFNNLRAGRRYRVHALDDFQGAADKPATTTLDIVVDRIEFCHSVSVQDALEDPTRSLFTIGSAHLLLTKLQFIKAVGDDEEAQRHSHRIVGRVGGKLLIGPEDKDIADVAALLYDRGVGSEDLQIDPETVKKALSSDWGFSETVALNVGNKSSFDHVLESRGAKSEVIDRVLTELETLASTVEAARRRARRPRFRLSKTWWQEVEETRA
jgi:hypothetical protein